MARPQKCRCICQMPKVSEFGPVAIKEQAEEIILGVDEYEVIRLLDLLHLSQEECAEQMNISRTTVTRMYENARRKIAETIINGKRLVIRGGEVLTCSASKPGCMYKKNCCHRHNEKGALK